MSLTLRPLPKGCSTFESWFGAAAGIPKGKPEDQELAWKRTFDFLKQHLG